MNIMEVLHGVFATYLHNTYIAEYNANTGPFDITAHSRNVQRLTEEIIAHEDAVIDYCFQANAPINDITSDQLKQFIRSRANKVLTDLGLEPMYTIISNPIADWFYKGANSLKLHDFFKAGTNQYRRGWSAQAFTRLSYLEANNEHN